MKKAIAKLVLALSGWRYEGDVPSERKYVLISYPHTSNWDFVFILAVAWAHDIGIHWIGKKEMFPWPFTGLFKSWGGIPVERSRNMNMTDQLAERFAEQDELIIAVPAEGTRSYVPRWKSGFYHIARKANVPVGLGYLDYPRKRAGIGKPRLMTGDVVADMDGIRAFYEGKQGKYPKKVGPVLLAEEGRDAVA